MNLLIHGDSLYFISPIYAAVMALILVYLSWRVVSLRNKYKVRMGDGGHTELIAATRAQDNLLEYLPTALILLLMLELLGYSAWIIHLMGLLLVIARLMHLKGIREPSGMSLSRKLGTRLTWIQIALSALLCIAGSLGFAR